MVPIWSIYCAYLIASKEPGQTTCHIFANYEHNIIIIIVILTYSIPTILNLRFCWVSDSRLRIKQLLIVMCAGLRFITFTWPTLNDTDIMLFLGHEYSYSSIQQYYSDIAMDSVPHNISIFVYLCILEQSKYNFELHEIWKIWWFGGGVHTQNLVPVFMEHQLRMGPDVYADIYT